MDLILVRHGRPERVDHDPTGADPGLTDLGHRQASAAASYLLDTNIDHLYVSPMLRAVETAAPLAELHGLTPTVVDDIAEFDIGEPSYIPGEEANYTAEDIDELFQKMTSPEFGERVIRGMEGIIASHPGDTAAAVCHGGVISRYVCHILGLNPTDTFLDAHYTSVTRIRGSASGRRSITTFNEHHWLRSL
jgi:probable phosphoglycerate mutase